LSKLDFRPLYFILRQLYQSDSLSLFVLLGSPDSSAVGQPYNSHTHTHTHTYIYTLMHSQVMLTGSYVAFLFDQLCSAHAQNFPPHSICLHRALHLRGNKLLQS